MSYRTPPEKRFLTLQNKVYDGGTASDDSIIILPKNTTTGLSEIESQMGLMAYDTDLGQLVIDKGMGGGFQPVDSSGGGAFSYIVGPGQEFADIQDAIDQGVADGVNGTQKATIIIYPKVNSAAYSENLTLAKGFTFKSADGFAFNNSITINGQHTYVAPGGGNPFVNDICFVGLSFYTSSPGDIFAITGSNALAIFNQCKFQHDGASGSCVDYNSSGFSPMVSFGCSAGSSASADPAFKVVGAFVAIKETDMAFLSGPGISINAGFVGYVTNVQLATSGTHALEVAGGWINLQGNLLSAGGTNANGLVVAAGATANMFNSSISAPAGTGYAVAGSGTMNGALNAYPGGNSAKDPALTFNLTPSDPAVMPIVSAASAGGGASEVLVVTGLLATDTVLSVSQKTAGANSLPLLGWTTVANNALTVQWSADPGAGAVVVVAVKR